jgi:hypothetical protein
MACEETIELIRGNSYDATVRWEDPETIVYKAITGITQAAPVVINCAGHGVPPGWRVAIVSVKGMTQINALGTPPKDSDYHKAAAPTSGTLTINDINASDYSAYKSSGYVQYNSPVDMTDFTARMQLRASVDDDTVLDEFTTEDTRLPETGIVIDNTNKTITINIAADVTAEYEFASAVWSLEMISPDDVITRIKHGDVTCEQDITRD